MNHQLGLFDRPAPYQRTSATSRAAAKAIEPKAGTQRAIVLAFVRGRGAEGATNEEIARGCGLLIQAVCPRVSELREARLIHDSEQRRVTVSGCSAVVWVAR